jgi:hypothetical protein
VPSGRHRGCHQVPPPNWWKLSGLKLLAKIEEGCIEEKIRLLGQQVANIVKFNFFMFVFLLLVIGLKIWILESSIQ